MKEKLMFIALIALILLAVMPANAQTITMANPDGFGERDIIVYFANGTTLAGIYNTSSTITLDPNLSYIFTLKPQVSSPLDDPGAFLTTIFAYITTNIIALIACIFLIGLLLVRR